MSCKASTDLLKLLILSFVQLDIPRSHVWMLPVYACGSKTENDYVIVKVNMVCLEIWLLVVSKPYEFALHLQ